MGKEEEAGEKSDEEQYAHKVTEDFRLRSFETSNLQSLTIYGTQKSEEANGTTNDGLGIETRASQDHEP